MKKIILLILLSLVIFVSCQKVEAKKDGTNEITIIEQEKLVEVVDKKTELEPLEVQTGSVQEQVVGIINDARVRLRSEPNLQSETLRFLNTGDSLVILDKSAEQQKIDNMENYWYKVQEGKQPEGWVYGAFVDIEKHYENKEAVIEEKEDIRNFDFLAMALKYNFSNSIDYSTGQPAFDPENSIYDTKKVKSITVPIKALGTVGTATYNYIDGQIISLLYSNVPWDETYEYDAEGRLTKKVEEGDGGNKVYTYTYPEVQNENEISRFTFRNDSHFSTETVRLIKEGYEITFDKFYLGKETYQFRYIDSVLQQVVEIGFKDTEVTWWDFSYEQGVVKKIVSTDKTEGIVYIRTMSYENFQLKELVYHRFAMFTDYKLRYHFSDYDEYGNWQTREDYGKEDDFVEKIYREIEYY